jgi:hypothetical protein
MKTSPPRLLSSTSCMSMKSQGFTVDLKLRTDHLQGLNLKFFLLFKQCCGTVMIYCGSGSDFGKVSVPVPDPVFQQAKKCTKPCLFSIRSKNVSQIVDLSFLIFLLPCSNLCWIRIQLRFRNRIRN